MNYLFILNDPPYGTERNYNALRFAISVSRRDGEQTKVFLIGDAVASAKAGQKVPPGYYNFEVMLKNLARQNVEIGVCGTCMDARGIQETDLSAGCRRSSLQELTNWSLWADKVVVF